MTRLDNNPRTIVIDAILSNANHTLGRDEIDAVLDAGLSSTNMTVWNSHPLLDWDEYRNAEL